MWLALASNWTPTQLLTHYILHQWDESQGENRKKRNEKAHELRLKQGDHLTVTNEGKTDLIVG